MDPLHAIPRKTAAARALLAQSRQGLPAALRMLLITVDGRKPLAELQQLARALGLDGRSAFARLRAEGLITGDTGAGTDAPAKTQAQAQAQAAQRAEQARRLVRAKFFALDLAARMLAGKEGALRERARTVHSESGFHAWMDECAGRIAQAADGERAALFRARVAAAAAAN